MGFLNTEWEKQASFARLGRLLNKGRSLALKHGPVDAAALSKFDDLARTIKNKGGASRWAAKNIPGDVRRLNMTQQANMLTDILGPDEAYRMYHAALKATGGNDVKALRFLRKNLEKQVRNGVATLSQKTKPQKLLQAPATSSKMLSAPATSSKMLPATVQAPKAGLAKADDVIDVAAASPGARSMRTTKGRVVPKPADVDAPVTAPKTSKPKSAPAAPEAPVKAPTQSSAAAATAAADEATAGMRNYNGGIPDSVVDAEDINKMLVGDAAEKYMPFELARWAHKNPGTAWLTAGLGSAGLLGLGGAVGHRIGQDAYYD